MIRFRRQCRRAAPARARRLPAGMSRKPAGRACVAARRSWAVDRD